MNGLLMKYFVLKPKGNDPFAKASRAAMMAYARSIKPGNPLLASELIAWAIKEQVLAKEEKERK